MLGSTDLSTLSAEAGTTHSEIECRALTKRFGDLVVLDALDLDVGRGEKLAVIGPSGSGKTTLLRLLMALDKPTSGRVTIGGEILWDEPSKRKERDLRKVRAKLGYVFQHFNLFPHMTALRNVAIAPMKVRKMGRQEAEAKARELLASVGLGDKADSYPAQLSGGQQQRVAIARALALDPEVMLFDEVTSALDPELVGEVQRTIVELGDRSNMTMVLVTHEMRFAARVANRVAFMEHGRVVEMGSPEQLVGDPQEPRTRAFLKAVLEPLY